MSSRLCISVSALLFLITPIASLAQSTPPQAPPTVHETVVVTATGRETPESKVGASIAVVNRDEIEQRHALSTIDLLRTIPGMVAVRSGGIGNLTSVFVRADFTSAYRPPSSMFEPVYRWCTPPCTLSSRKICCS